MLSINPFILHWTQYKSYTINYFYWLNLSLSLIYTKPLLEDHSQWVFQKFPLLSPKAPNPTTQTHRGINSQRKFHGQELIHYFVLVLTYKPVPVLVSTWSLTYGYKTSPNAYTQIGPLRKIILLLKHGFIPKSVPTFKPFFYIQISPYIQAIPHA